MPRNLPALDLTIVFGEGPVKPVLLPEELTSAQREIWTTFKQNPLIHAEPDFRVIEGKAYLSSLAAIDARKDIDDSDKSSRKHQLRSSWQRSGRLALKRMGRQTALAAGTALVEGLTQRVVLTGGRTGVARPDFAPDVWPSEAELMADIIRRTFGRSYYRIHKEPIDSVIGIEPDARNTLENVVLSINRFPELVEAEQRIGLLTADQHLARCALIAEMFSMQVAPDGKLSAQSILHSRANEIAHRPCRERYQQIEAYMTDLAHNTWLQDIVKGEHRFINGLTEDRYISYWFGYVFMLNDPRIIQIIVNRTLSYPDKMPALTDVLNKVGMTLEDIEEVDFARLAATDYQLYLETKAKLAELTRHRAMPPEVKTLPSFPISREEAGGVVA